MQSDRSIVTSLKSFTAFAVLLVSSESEFEEFEELLDNTLYQSAILVSRNLAQMMSAVWPRAYSPPAEHNSKHAKNFKSQTTDGTGIENANYIRQVLY